MKPSRYELDPEGPSGQFRIRVSSRHLCLASPVFKKILEGPWVESTPHGPLLREIRIRSWSIDALIIVLDIVHGHHREVPKYLSLELLTHVSMIVGYYQCQEVTQVFAENWAKRVELWLPRTYGEESTLMLIVSWVFSRVDVFEKMSKLALTSSEGLITTPGLFMPVPEHIFAEIEEQRKLELGRIFEALYGLLDDPEDTGPGCSFECSSMMLGSLLIEMNWKGLQNPRVTAPYTRRSISSARNLISELRNPQWSRSNSDCGLQCTVQAKLQPVLDQVSKHIDQLKLWDYGQE
ncbi:hypothetical protein EDB81DRAFT_841176 [Dactylonectria macrodidyma]|uniref:BTB domain-containing protein n=1 Tax=Dactylonectria macrodidyma TaxID=307937 RepID=A0A9P9F339_9HYPO|nr:hypothetical protein EDB81DRAFT_841176 [Dactylonectria macrodidyma]